MVHRITMAVCAAASLLLVVYSLVRVAADPRTYASPRSPGGDGWLVIPLLAAYSIGVRSAALSTLGPGAMKKFRRIQPKGLAFIRTAARLLPGYWLYAASFQLTTSGAFFFLSFGVIGNTTSAVTAISGAAMLLGVSLGAVWMAGIALGWRRRGRASVDVMRDNKPGEAFRSVYETSSGGQECEFSGGGVIGGQVKVGVPGLRLVVTPEQLEFHGSWWTGRVLGLGPWFMPRDQVQEIYGKQPRSLPPWTWDVVIVGTEPNSRWTFWSREDSGPLLLTLEECGYPVDWIPRNRFGVPETT